MAKQLAAVLSADALVVGAVEGAELLRNGSFRELDDAGRPAGWRVANDGQRDDLDKQEGVLRVDIAKAGENDGQIVQRLEGLSAGRAYVLSGRLRSTKTGLEYGRFVDDASGRVINYQAGVHVCDGSSQVAVEHCFVHAPGCGTAVPSFAASMPAPRISGRPTPSKRSGGRWCFTVSKSFFACSDKGSS